MTIDDALRHPPPPRARAQDRSASFSLWLGYLSLGGTLSLIELNDGLGGRAPIADTDLYLLAQAHNV